VNRVHARNVARRTGGDISQEGRRTATGSQSDPGEASSMQRILRSRASRLRGNQEICGIGKLSAPNTAGTASTSGIETLAPAFGQALPSLAGVRAEYNHEVNAELVYELCAALVREGLGTAETWEKSGGNALAFAQYAMINAIDTERSDLLQRNVEYHLEVSDQLGRAGSDVELESGQLVVTVECGGSGYFRIGPALDALEAEAEGLGAAFYWALTFALYRVMWIYNHDNALMYEERMRDYAAEDDAENQGQYEFPEVDKALPECIRKTQKRESLDWKAHDRALLRRFRNGKYSSWFERLRRIQCLSRLQLKQSREFLELGYYDDPPLPSLLVAFKEHDAITACFDEEGQSMMEGTAEPTVCVVFSPRQPDQVRHAIRIVDRFIALNCALFELVEEIQEWEKRDAGTSIDRGDPSLRVA
jgi:DNA-binding transcriptional ArsR family regulator